MKRTASVKTPKLRVRCAVCGSPEVAEVGIYAGCRRCGNRWVIP